MLLRCVFRGPTDHIFVILGSFWNPLWSHMCHFFDGAGNLEKCNPSCTESLLLTFWGHDFSTFFGTYVKTHSRTCFLQFCCRFGLALGLHFGAFGLTFSSFFSSPQKKQKIRFCVLLRWRYLGHITEEGGNQAGDGKPGSTSYWQLG